MHVVFHITFGTDVAPNLLLKSHANLKCFSIHIYELHENTWFQLFEYHYSVYIGV